MLSTKVDSVRLYKIRKVISELSGKVGRGTELVSLYIPPKKPIHEVIAYLRNEWGTAGNIKSDTTRNHVQDALTKTMQKLKLYKETPDDGLVIFCGALMTNGPGSEVIMLREIVPPKPVKSFMYMCVAPDTKVLMDDGTQKTIGALKSSWKDERVMSWDAGRRQVVGGPIRDYLNAPVDGRRTYRLTTESGRSIVATEDHPFQTPNGWVRLGQLKKGDFVCVLPVADIAPEDRRAGAAEHKVILTEESLRKMQIGEYLRIKSQVRARDRETMVRAQQMRAEGSEAEQIGALLMLTKAKTKGWAAAGGRRVRSPVVKSTQLPAFDEWLKVARTGLEEPLLWESISSIEEEPIPDVRDLTVENGNHSFFANGFLVHNCDDHFHIDQLKEMLREEKVYGLLSIDANEAGVGILSGETFNVVNVMTSGISGKTRKGGQCVSAETLVQLEDGRLAPISNVTPRSRIASYNFWTYTHGVYECADTFSIVPKDYYVVETMRPKMKISATGEHRFFTLAKDGGVSSVEASKLKPGAKVLVSRRLQEPLNPTLSTGFPGAFRYHVTGEGRRLLKELRLRQGLSQERVARALRMHQTEVSQLERGERDLSWEKLQPIVRLLGQDVDEFSTRYVETIRDLPEYFTPELLQLLGYIAGDGNAGENRVCLYEYRTQVAKVYADLAKSALYLDYVPVKKVDRRGGGSSFAKHRHLETRIYFKQFVDALREHYPGLVSSTSREIPERIHRLDNKHLAYFVRGLFDAEANARERRRIGLAMKSGLLIRQLQMLLLRFGIIASYSTYVNRFGSTMHALDISDYDSLQAFYTHIGFTADDKQERLRHGIETGPRPQSYHGVPAIGSWMDKRAKELGIKRRQFQGITNFFHDQRGASPRVFQRTLGTFQSELAQARDSNSSVERIQLLEDTVSQLKRIEASELILVTVKDARRVKNSKKERFIDIELPSTRSFIGNGFVLHNSARRYERGREMELTYFYHRVADHANRILVDEYKVNGLIVGGPGYTKEDFLKTEYLNYNLRKNIIAVIDSAYSGREGVRELVDKAADKLQDVRLFEEKKLVQRFLGEVNKPNGLAVYGLPRILQALEKGNVETILVTDDVDTVRVTATCKNCQTVREKFVPNSKKTQEMHEIVSEPCASCGSKEFFVEETDIVDLLEERAIQVGAKVEVISSGTEEGAMLKSFGGVAAFLRYRIAGT